MPRLVLSLVLLGCAPPPDTAEDDPQVLEERGRVLAVSTNGEILALVTERDARDDVWLSVFDLHGERIAEHLLARELYEQTQIEVAADGAIWVSRVEEEGTTRGGILRLTTLVRFELRPEPEGGSRLEEAFTLPYRWPIDGWGVDESGHVGLGGPMPDSRHTQVARLSPTGEVLWRNQLQTDVAGCGGFDVATDGRILCAQRFGGHPWALYEPDGVVRVLGQAGHQASSVARFLRDGSVAIGTAGGSIGIYEATGEPRAILPHERDFDVSTVEPSIDLQPDPRNDTLYVTLRDASGAHVRRHDFDGYGREHWLLPHPDDELRTHHLLVLPDGSRRVVVGLDADSRDDASVVLEDL